jgi:hypothetical protein
LQLGYTRLNPADYVTSREEDFTGCLTAEMKAVLRSRTAPDWTADLVVQDEVYVEDDLRRGKRRLRIDIEFERVRRGPRPIFQFEAKRLRSRASLNAYLGPGGLGCFLDGRYAANQNTAGMLGYVQSGTIDERADQLGTRLSTPGGPYAVLPDGTWQPVAIVAALTTRQTTHRRRKPLPAITVLHTLLTFC